MLAELAGLDPLVLLAAEGKPPPEGVAFLESSSSGGLSAWLRRPFRPRRAHRGAVGKRQARLVHDEGCAGDYVAAALVPAPGQPQGLPLQGDGNS